MSFFGNFARELLNRDSREVVLDDFGQVHPHRECRADVRTVAAAFAVIDTFYGSHRGFDDVQDFPDSEFCDRLCELVTATFAARTFENFVFDESSENRFEIFFR